MNLLWSQSRRVKLALDLGAWAIALPIAFVARLEAGPDAWARSALALAFVSAPGIILVTLQAQLQRQSWGHFSFKDATRLGAAGAVNIAIMVALVMLIRQIAPWIVIPRSIPIIAGVVATGISAAMRLSIRAWTESSGGIGTKIVIAGTGDQAIWIARKAMQDGAKILGFIDENPTRHGLSFLGSPVLGSSQHASDILARQPDEIIITYEPHSQPAERIEAVARRNGIRCRYTGDMEALLLGRLQKNREDTWGLKDLLEREPIKLDNQAIQDMVEGKRVLVTGAGGSIGSELVRQLIELRPQELFMLSHDENSIFEFQQTLPDATRTTLLVADIKDTSRINHLFQKHRPQVLFHAAAHKHAPLMEAHPDEAVANNVGGTKNLLEAAKKHGVERFINISTDKAVNPSNVMGTTKRVCELMCLQAAKGGLNVVSVRFGNVLGSRGSVIPTWEKQIQKGGPVTVTDPEMTRYFMLIPEAVQLVLQAAAVGEPGRIYVLDMGKPVNIMEFAKNLIREHGLVPGKDIQIQVTGLRPGEKMHEELMLDDSEPGPHPLIFVEADRELPDDFDALVQALLGKAASHDEQATREALRRLVPSAKI